MEDYEAMVPFQALQMLGFRVGAGPGRMGEGRCRSGCLHCPAAPQLRSCCCRHRCCARRLQLQLPPLPLQLAPLASHSWSCTLHVGLPSGTQLRS